jgi:hypothetical protein
MLDALDDISGAVALTALVVATLAILLALAAYRRGGREGAPAVERLTDDPSLERYVAAQAERLEALSSAVGGLREQAGAADSVMRHAVQHVGLVRFNPFDDTGGNQSFALALLDANADGIVLSSLHSRAATRVYVKAILGGKSDGTLSAEEIAALRDAGLQI